MRRDESSEDFDRQLFNKLPPDYFSKPAPAVLEISDYSALAIWTAAL